ncbi:MAG: exo-alpha-sialidase, partial [Acidobacteria bacterium]|nr:exo-alpha-sialidase [Acidobacteriota bacterium]
MNAPSSRRHRRFAIRAALVAIPLLALSAGSAFAAQEKGAAGTEPDAPTAAECALLDDPNIAGRLDGLLVYLAKGCGREAEFFGGVLSGEGYPGDPSESPESGGTPVSNPAQDTSGTAKTQSETSIAFNPTTNVLCAAWNDSFHGVTEGVGFSGFGRSIDGGSTWTDSGAVSPSSNFDTGDPSLVWRKSDGKFYYAALKGGGLGLYRSDDDCQSFTFLSQIASGSDDKELMTVDNNDGSPYYGRLYIVWTDFGQSGRIFETHSDNGTTWSTQVALSGATDDVQGAWPVVAPNNDVYAAWVRWNPYPSGPIDIQVSRSTDGGATWGLVANPMTGQVNPRDSSATSSCGRPALGGNIRYLPSPTIAVDGSGNLHVVYSYDPDGFNTGDESSVFYRRSTTQGASWDPEILINDDGTTTDQWQPSLSVGAGNVVTVGYYSRQNDTGGNLMFDYYSRTSYDGGASFQP